VEDAAYDLDKAGQAGLRRNPIGRPELQTPVSMPPAIDPNMVLMMNAKEGQPAYWWNGENGLKFVRWAAPVPAPDSRFEVGKDRLVVKVQGSGTRTK
jgi:hypothetical protein